MKGWDTMRFNKKIFFIVVISFFILITNYDHCQAKTIHSYADPSIEIIIGECQWNGIQSLTEVTFSATNTELTIYKPAGGSFSVVQSISPKTLYLPNGTYDYMWKDDYDPTFTIWKTKVYDSFTLQSCIPEASVNFDHGVCQWDATNGSITPVTVELDHAELTLDGVTYTASPTTVHFSPGTYSYSWVPTDGYQGGVTNQTLTVDNCNPTASVSHIIGNCHHIGGQSLTSVSFNITGADVVVSGSNGDVYYPTATTPTLSLPAGAYSYTWDLLPHYNGLNGARSFSLGTCIPANVSYNIGDCNWDTQPPSRSLSFSVSGATVTLNGPGGPFTPFSFSNIFENLAPGRYNYDWLANPGYTGSGYVDLELPECQPGVASVSVNLIACGFDDQNNPYADVAVSLTGSKLSINGEIIQESTNIHLPPGIYEYSWWAKSSFEGQGEGEIDTEICMPKASPEISVEIGSCSIQNGQSLTEVFLFISGAELSLTNLDNALYGPYTSSQTVSLSPGEYHYEWTSTTGDESTGEGVFIVNSCKSENTETTKEINVKVDTTPDQPAGDIGPSLISKAIFSLFGVTLIILILYLVGLKGISF
jgi:hypothetical protein